jgi:hypothetical protein
MIFLGGDLWVHVHLTNLSHSPRAHFSRRIILLIKDQYPMEVITITEHISRALHFEDYYIVY